MLAPEPVLTLDDARRIVAEQGFTATASSTSPARLGIEIEWHTVRIDAPDHPVPFDLLETTVPHIELPGRSRLTFEPGGQVELSSQALPGFDSAAAIRADTHALTR